MYYDNSIIHLQIKVLIIKINIFVIKEKRNDTITYSRAGCSKLSAKPSTTRRGSLKCEQSHPARQNCRMSCG